MTSNTHLTSWIGDLSSLTNARGMFNGCWNLTTFNADLPSLTDGSYMFSVCKSLTTFTTDLPSLTNGSNMFYYCEKLTSFSSDLPSLTNGRNMFSDCNLDAPSVKNIALTINKNVTGNPRIDLGINSSIISDEQVKKDIGLIKHKGWNVWRNNSNATSTYTLPKYAGCSNIDSIWAKDANYLTNDIVNGVWSEHLPDLESCFGMDGESLIKYDKNLTTFDADLSSLTLGNRMFYDCKNLESFNSNLSSLTNGTQMFYDCKNLESFNSNLSSLTDAWYMFNGCSALTSFSSDLSSLTEGRYMFSGCPLLSFSSNLGSLTNGEGMFSGCLLDADSMENIANTLPNTTNGWIDIRYGYPSS